MEHTLRNLPRHQALQDRLRDLPEEDALSVTTFLLFLRVASDMIGGLQDYFAHYRLSDGKLAVLLSLYDTSDGSSTPSQLAEQLAVTRGTITGLLDGLERSGLIERDDYPADRRMLTIRLTASGKAFVDRFLPEHLRHIKLLMSHLNEAEQRQMVMLLEKLISGISELK